MDVEIQVAVQFIISFFSGKFTKEKEGDFLNNLRKLLTQKFEGHWYPEKPSKGSAYRCLSIENHLDAVIVKAAKSSGIDDLSSLSKLLPKRLDLWIDPAEVSYRIGEHGPVIVIYKEGDDCVNSTSEYLAKVLDQLATVTQKDGGVSKSSSKPNKFSMNALPQVTSNTPHLAHNINTATLQQHHRAENHLSPAAKTFISRSNGMNIPYMNNHTFPPVMQPLLNMEYLQKLHWPLLATSGYDPLAAQLIHNYLIMQELQKFETRRLALQSHYMKMQNMRWGKKTHSSNKQHSSSSNSSNTGLQISA